MYKIINKLGGFGPVTGFLSDQGGIKFDQLNSGAAVVTDLECL